MDWAPWSDAIASAESRFNEASKLAEEKLEEAKALALGTPIIKAKPDPEEEEDNLPPLPRTWELEEADDDEFDSEVGSEFVVEKEEEKVERVLSDTMTPVMDSSSAEVIPTQTATAPVPIIAPADWAVDIEEVEEEEGKSIAALEASIPITLPEAADSASNDVEVFHRRSFKRLYDFPNAPPLDSNKQSESVGDGPNTDLKEVYNNEGDHSKSTVDELLEGSTKELPSMGVTWDSEDGELVSVCDFEESGDELDSGEEYSEYESAAVEDLLPLPSEVTQRALASFISQRLSSNGQSAALTATQETRPVVSPDDQSREMTTPVLSNEASGIIGDEAANDEVSAPAEDEFSAKSTSGVDQPETNAEASVPESGSSEVDTSRGSMVAHPELIYETEPPVTGASEKIGRRPTMEDKWSFVGDFVPSHPSWFAGVFDGHGGENCAVKTFIQELTVTHLFLPFFSSSLRFLFKMFCVCLGDQASIFVASKLPSALASSLQNAPSQEQLVHDHAFVEAALTSAFETTDTELLANPEESAAGCTATVCLKLGRKLYCANTGDSRTVLAYGTRDRINGTWLQPVASQPLSLDQKPSDSGEKARIKERGGLVSNGRLMGELGVARAFGDRDYKKSIRTLQQEDGDGGEDSGDEDLGPEDPRNLNLLIATPEITVTDLDKSSATENTGSGDLASTPATPLFVLLACDGLWDVMSNDDACQLVASALDANNGDCAQALHALTDHAIEVLGSSDNVTATMVLLQPWWQPQNTPVKAMPTAVQEPTDNEARFSGGDAFEVGAEAEAKVEVEAALDAKAVVTMGGGVEEEKKGEPAWLHGDGNDNEEALEATFETTGAEPENSDAVKHAAASPAPVTPAPPPTRPAEAPEVSVDYILKMLRSSARPSPVAASDTNDSNEPSQEWLKQPLPTARAVRGVRSKRPPAPAPHRALPPAMSNNSRTRNVASAVQSLLCETFVRDAAAQGAEHCFLALKEQLSQMDQLNAPKHEKSLPSLFSAQIRAHISTAEPMAKPEFLALQLSAVLIQTAARGVLARSRTTELFAAFNQHKHAGGFARSPIDPEALEVVEQFETGLTVLEDKLLANSDVSPLSAVGLVQHLKEQVAHLRSRVDRGGSNGSMSACAAVLSSIEGQIKEVQLTALPPSLPERAPAAAGRRTAFGAASSGLKPKGRVSLIATAKAAVAAHTIKR